MALFGGSRDISLFNTLSKELINDIIQTEVGYYKFALERTTSIEKTKHGQPMNLGLTLIKALIFVF